MLSNRKEFVAYHTWEEREGKNSLKKNVIIKNYCVSVHKTLHKIGYDQIVFWTL
jgi:hypothetical protein